jgi:hypothetical protein
MALSDVFRLFSSHSKDVEVDWSHKGLARLRDFIQAERKELNTDFVNINAHIIVLIDELHDSISSSKERKKHTLFLSSAEMASEKIRDFDHLVLEAIERIEHNKESKENRYSSEKELIEAIIHSGANFQRRWTEVGGSFNNYSDAEDVTLALFKELGVEIREERRAEKLIEKLLTRNVMLDTKTMSKIKEESDSLGSMKSKLEGLKGTQSSDLRAVERSLASIKLIKGGILHYDKTVIGLLQQFMSLLRDEENRFIKVKNIIDTKSVYFKIDHIVKFAESLIQDETKKVGGLNITNKSIVSRKLDLVQQLRHHFQRKLEALGNLYVASGRLDSELAEVIEKRHAEKELGVPEKRGPNQIHLILPDIKDVASAEAEYRNDLTKALAISLKGVSLGMRGEIFTNLVKLIGKCLSTPADRSGLLAMTKVLKKAIGDSSAALSRVKGSIYALRRSGKTVPQHLVDQVKKEATYFTRYSSMQSQLSYVLKYFSSVNVLVGLKKNETLHDLKKFFFTHSKINGFSTIKDVLAFIWFFVYNQIEIDKITQEKELIADSKKQQLNYYELFIDADLYPPLDSKGSMPADVVKERIHDTRANMEKVTIHPAN